MTPTAPQFLKHAPPAAGPARLTVEEQEGLADCANLAVVLGCAARAFSEDEPSRKELDAIAALSTRLGEELHALLQALTA